MMMRCAGLLVLAGAACAAQVAPLDPKPVEYPRLARQAQIQDTVRISGTVDSSGAVALDDDAMTGHPLLAGPAGKAVVQWRFPKDEKSTGRAIRLTFEFRITKPCADGQAETKFVMLDPSHFDISVPVPCANTGVTKAEPSPDLQFDDTPLRFEDTDSLEYEGCRIEKAYDEVQRCWTARVSREGRIIGNMPVCMHSEKEIQFGMFQLLDSQHKQLVVKTWSGGAHCCDTYFIADLLPRFRMVYDGRDYDMNSLHGASDLDGDGYVELWFENRTFDYFWSSFADSPRVDSYLGYDAKIGMYLPANGTLSRWALKGIEEQSAAVVRRNQADEIPDDEVMDYRSSVLNVVMAYIYAQRPAEGWAFFDKQLQAGRQGRVEDRS